MTGRAVAFQNSYNRAAAAVLLWCVAGLFPILVVSARAPNLKNVTGVALASMYSIYGLFQLQAAIRKRQWSDIVMFGIIPAVLFATCAVALAVEG